MENKAIKTGDCKTETAAGKIGQENATNIYKYPLLKHLQDKLQPPCEGDTYLTKGDWAFFHYACDGYRDNGWGCAYRSLQSMCSWILTKLNKKQQSPPTIPDIQETLVRIGDKPNKFVGSHDWIGSLEICYVIDSLYDVPCKVIHVPKCGDLKNYKNELCEYFRKYGGFIMMGGDVDTGSNGIAGIHVSEEKVYFLVIDPHYVGVPKSVEELVERGYIRWQNTCDFVESSFYNLCLPQVK